MLKVAITGASSFIGAHLLEKLSCSNLAINALIHKTQAKSTFYDPAPLLKRDNVAVYSGNLLESSTLEDFIKGCDVVIHLAYLWKEDHIQNLEAIKNLANLCVLYKIKRFIHCSTTSVYGATKVNFIDETTPCLPQTQYAKTKLAIENYLVKNYTDSFEIAVLRPTQVFGPGGKNLVKLAYDLTQGSVFKNYLKSCVMAKKPMNLVCVDNVVGALEYLMHIKKLDHYIYLISDDEVPNNYFYDVENYLIKRLRGSNYSIPYITLPLFFYKIFFRLMGKGATNPQMVYCGKNLAESGYIKPMGFEEGLNKFADWYVLTVA